MIEILLMNSIEPPKYEVPAVYAEYEACVASRESNRRADAVSKTGKYRGMYQMNDELADGSTYWIVDWIATWHPAPKEYAERLRMTPINKWPAPVQTAAFVATLDGHGEHKRWAGRFHWNATVPGTECT